MPRTNKTKYAILGFLSSGPKSGYDIKRESEYCIGYFWHESYGSIYPMMKRLTTEGLVTRELDTEGGVHDRILYHMTEKGWAELKDWLRRPPDPPVLRDELLLKITFGGHGSFRDLAAHVNRCRIYYQDRLSTLDRIQQRLHENLSTHPTLPLWLITINMGRHRANAYIAWCDETLETLAELDAGDTKDTS